MSAVLGKKIQIKSDRYEKIFSIRICFNNNFSRSKLEEMRRKRYLLLLKANSSSASSPSSSFSSSCSSLPRQERRDDDEGKGGWRCDDEDVLLQVIVFQQRVYYVGFLCGSSLCCQFSHPIGIIQAAAPQGTDVKFLECWKLVMLNNFASYSSLFKCGIIR